MAYKSRRNRYIAKCAVCDETLLLWAHEAPQMRESKSSWIWATLAKRGWSNAEQMYGGALLICPVCSEQWADSIELESPPNGAKASG